jgi:ribosomal protein L24
MKKNIKFHVKKDDQIKIISVKYKGIIGNIILVLKKKSKIIINTIKPRIKYIKNSLQEIEKVERPISIHISNVLLLK